MPHTNLRNFWMIPGLLLLTAILFFGCSSPPEYDVIIKNGRIIDGSGNPSFSGDIAINADTIAAIGDLDKAKAGEIIDATGLAVAPGFISWKLFGI
jgi:N-acyl-D-amino-acid deacylase